MTRRNDTIEGSARPEGGSPGWRRRRFVVDARYQLRSGVLVGITALVLLILLNASLMVHEPAGASTVGPSVRPVIGGQDRATFGLLIFGSGVFFAGVVLVGLLESHRTAGAAFAIRRAVEGIREGRSAIRVRLRRRDHLQELARSINQLAETIETERARRG